MVAYQLVSRAQYQAYRHSGEIPAIGRIFSNRIKRNRIPSGHQYLLIRALDIPTNPIIGTLLLKHMDGEIPVTKIIDIILDDKYRNRGYGSQIMQMIIIEAKRFGSFLIRLFVFSHREIARHIYKKLGFITQQTFNSGESMILPIS